MKVTTIVKQQFIFKNSSYEMYPLLMDILSCIKENVTREAYNSLSGNCKMVVIELLTNALKHSDIAATKLDLSIYDDHIVISKTDNGTAFFITPSHNIAPVKFPASKSLQGKRLVIYQDDISSLYGMFETPQKLIFTTEDFNVSIPPVPVNLLEHYGLMIITKASDEFVYTFDSETGTNLFTVKMKY